MSAPATIRRGSASGRSRATTCGAICDGRSDTNSPSWPMRSRTRESAWIRRSSVYFRDGSKSACNADVNAETHPLPREPDPSRMGSTPTTGTKEARRESAPIRVDSVLEASEGAREDKRWPKCDEMVPTNPSATSATPATCSNNSVMVWNAWTTTVGSRSDSREMRRGSETSTSEASEAGDDSISADRTWNAARRTFQEMSSSSSVNPSSESSNSESNKSSSSESSSPSSSSSSLPPPPLGISSAGVSVCPNEP